MLGKPQHYTFTTCKENQDIRIGLGPKDVYGHKKEGMFMTNVKNGYMKIDR